MYKTHHARTTFGSWDVERLHAVVARRTFPSQNVQSTPGSDHFWKLRCRKSARRCGAKHISKSTCIKHFSVGPLLEVAMSKKCTPYWREAHFEVKSTKHFSVGPLLEVVMSKKCALLWREKHISKSKCEKHHMFAPFLDVQMCFRVAGARDCAPSQKWAKRDVAFPKTMAGVGHFWRGSAKMHFAWQAQYKRHVHQRCYRRSGRWFPERGCILEHQICRLAKMILRDRCSTPYDLASIFRGRRNSLDRWSEKIAKRIGTRPSALHSTLDFWKEVSQNCFVFEVVKTKKMNKSHGIASLWMLSSSKNEEVLQNCFVFDVV